MNAIKDITSYINPTDIIIKCLILVVLGIILYIIGRKKEIIQRKKYIIKSKNNNIIKIAKYLGILLLSIGFINISTLILGSTIIAII